MRDKLLVTYSKVKPLSLCAISDICHLRFVSLNYVGLLKQSVEINTIFDFVNSNNTSRFQDDTSIVCGIYIMTFSSTFDHFMNNLAANRIGNVFEMELSILLSTLEMFACTIWLEMGSFISLCVTILKNT